jgi:hypothetical protein
MDRSIVHASPAYRLSQLLGYDKLYEESVSRGMQFDREMRFRSFWASWCSFNLSSEQLDPFRVFEQVADLLLPAKFGKGGSIQGVDLSQGQKMDIDWQPRTEISVDRGISSSLTAELVKAVRIW